MIIPEEACFAWSMSSLAMAMPSNAFSVMLPSLIGLEATLLNNSSSDTLTGLSMLDAELYSAVWKPISAPLTNLSVKSIIRGRLISAKSLPGWVACIRDLDGVAKK